MIASIMKLAVCAIPSHPDGDLWLMNASAVTGSNDPKF
jgi:hypothetical protein